MNSPKVLFLLYQSYLPQFLIINKWPVLVFIHLQLHLMLYNVCKTSYNNLSYNSYKQSFPLQSLFVLSLKVNKIFKKSDVQMFMRNQKDNVVCPADFPVSENLLIAVKC